MKLLALILSLPTENATARQRAWRSLKASGAAVLRDGVYLMPEREDCRATLDGLASDVRDAGGAAHVLRVEEPEGANFTDLFDRGEDYAAVLGEVVQVRNVLTADTVQDTLKQVRKLRKAFASLVEIDFFPDEAQQQTDKALQELELACARALSPDEPHAMAGVIARLHSSDYQERTWATRQRPWVDRLASAWLIRRFIDPQARILWLASPGIVRPMRWVSTSTARPSVMSAVASPSRCWRQASAWSSPLSHGWVYLCITSTWAACSRPRPPVSRAC